MIKIFRKNVDHIRFDFKGETRFLLNYRFCKDKNSKSKKKKDENIGKVLKTGYLISLDFHSSSMTIAIWLQQVTLLYEKNKNKFKIKYNVLLFTSAKCHNYD